MTRLHFLLDTGANVSVVPKKLFPKAKNNPDFHLYAANQSEIKTYGEIRLELSLDLRRSFPFNFIIADVSQAIIGCDFLSKYNLSINISKRTLYDGHTSLQIKGEKSASSIHRLSCFPATSEVNQFTALLQKYPQLCNSEPVSTSEEPVLFHHIETTGPPVFQRARRLAPDKLEVVRKEIQHLLNNGTIRPSKSQWSSPIHLVKKSSGDFRITGDYRLVNAQTIPDRYTPRHMRDFSAGLHGKFFLSKLDIRAAYHDVPIAPNDIEKTAINTPLGLYEYLKMPFGLRNSGSTHARFMDTIFRDLQDFIYIYVDDILIYSASEKEHLKHLQIVFERLKKYGMKINPSKCELGVSELNFLGHRVSTTGIHPTEEKIEVIKNFPIPKTLKDLSSFLGLLNFYRPFMPNIATKIKPLCRLTGGLKKNSKVPVNWNDELQTAFESAKSALIDCTWLQHPDSDTHISIAVDASSTGIGAVLQQLCKKSGNWQPISFYSYSLSKSQINYSTFSRELLGIYKAMKHFRYFIEFKDNLTIFTDHLPIVHAIKAKNLNNHSALHARYLNFILQYTSDIRYTKGDQMQADALSRIQLNNICVSDSNDEFCIDYEKIALEQKSDDYIKKLLQNSEDNSIQLQLINIPNSNVPLYCDVSNSKIRPYITDSFKKIVFNSLHNLSHPGIKATQKLIVNRFLWKNINSDVRKWTKSCINCCKAKIIRHNKSRVHNLPLPTNKFKSINMDIVGPLYESNGYRYILTIIDKYSSFPEAIPLQNITAETVLNAFLLNWIARFGCPETLITDNGSNFRSKLFSDSMSMLGIKHIFTTAYHPQANGKIERFHRQLKASLMSKTETWSNSLPLILLGIRSCYKQNLGTSPAEILYGCTIRLPGEIFTPQSYRSTLDPYTYTSVLKESMHNLLPRKKLTYNYDNAFTLPNLKDANLVFIKQFGKKGLTPPYSGPYRVIKKYEKVYIIEINGKKESISIDRLKPYFFENEEIQDININHQDSSNSSTIPFIPQNSSTTNGNDNYVTRFGRHVKKTIKFQY